MLRRVAASTLSDICGHSAELAAEVVAAGAVHAVDFSLRLALSNDARLKRQLLCVLMNICKAGPTQAAEVVGAGLLPDIGRCAGQHVKQCRMPTFQEICGSIRQRAFS